MLRRAARRAHDRARPGRPRPARQGAPDPPARARLPGLRLQGPRPLVGRRRARSTTTASSTASTRPTTSSRSATTSRRTCRSCLHLAQAFTLYDRYFARSWADLPQPPLPVGGPVRRPDDERDPADRSATSGRRSSTGRAPPGSASATTTSDLPFAALYGARAVPGCSRVASSTPTPRPATCPTSPSSTRRSTARTRASRATSTRTATSGSARPSCRDVVHAFIESPQFRRGAMFVNYDEWGGFFDHVSPSLRPRRPPSKQALEELRHHRLPHSRRSRSRPGCAAATSATRP